MMSEKGMALAQANDFLRNYLDDLERGEARSLSEYVRNHPGSDRLLPELWNDLHARADIATGAMPTANHAARLSEAGRCLANEPDSIAELVERALAERTAATPHDLIEGFELIEEVGRGGQGRVYRARDRQLDREVAIKLLPTGAGPDELRRLRREGEIAARLDDPCLCKAFAVGECDRGTYIVMQFVRGESLAAHIAASDTGIIELPNAAGTRQDAVLHFVERMARTLERMHATGVLHRDIKPGNVMVADDGRPVILDLGLARTTDDVTLTRADSLLGTLDYMAPELLADAAAGHDARTEVWSLGVLLFECLTRHRPFVAATRVGLAETIQKAVLDREQLQGLPRDLRAVVETALERDRERRYATAGAFADDLKRLQRREPVLARPIGPVLRMQRAVQRRPATAIALAAALVVPSIWAVQAEIGERRATRYLGETLGTVESMLVQLASVDLDDMPRGVALRRSLLADAATRYHRLADDDRLADEIGSGLARVEIELARLAMEQDLLDDAVRYVTSGRQRLKRQLTSNPKDSDLQLSAATAALRHAAILIRKGEIGPALTQLQATDSDLAHHKPTDTVRAIRVDTLMHLADASRRLNQFDTAQQSLEAAISVTNEFSTPAHAAAAVAWLGLAELHRMRGQSEDFVRALYASEAATLLAFRKSPLSRFLMGIFCTHQLYRADERQLDPDITVVRANLRRAEDVLLELGNVYPHWSQVAMLRWQYNWRDVRALVHENRPSQAEAVVERALTDIDAFGDRLLSSREPLFVAASMMNRIAELLPESGAFAHAHEAAATRAADLQQVIDKRQLQAGKSTTCDEASWMTFMRLLIPHHLNRPREDEAVRPSSALARSAANGMDLLGLRLAREGNGEAALEQYITAHHVMATAYARDPVRITRRMLYYTMDRHARQLMLLGRWDEAIEVREASLPHFLSEASQRSVELLRDFWLGRGPLRETSPLSLPDTVLEPTVRIRFAKVIAKSIAHLDQDERMDPLDKFKVRRALVVNGRAITDAAIAAGWQPDVHPKEDALLRLLYP